MSEFAMTRECQEHLKTAFAIAAAAPTEAAASGRIVTFLEGLLGPVWTQIKAAIASGAITPAAILAYLQTLGVTVPSWLLTILEILLPLVLKSVQPTPAV